MRCFQQAHTPPPARSVRAHSAAAAPHPQLCAPHRHPQPHVRLHAQPSVPGAQEARHSHELAGGEGPRTNTAHRVHSLVKWQQLWQQGPAKQQQQQVPHGEQLLKPIHPGQQQQQQRQQVHAGEQLLKPIHPGQQQQQQQAGHRAPRFFRHQASWRPLPPNQQEAACVEQQQELSSAIQATEDLASLQNLLHSYIGHPVLDAVHIALALTQVRRLMGADSSYALARSKTTLQASPAWDSSSSSSAATAVKHGHAPSARGWAHAHAQGAGAAVLLPHEARAAPKRGRRQKEAQEMQVAKTVDLILDASLPLIPSFGTVEVTASLHALARLQVHTSSAWSDTFLEHAHSLMPRYTLQQLSTLAWSLGSLGLDPGPQWLDNLCLAAAALLESLAEYQSSSSSSGGGWPSNGGVRGEERNGSGAVCGAEERVQAADVHEEGLSSVMGDWEDSLDSLWVRSTGDGGHGTSTGYPHTTHGLNGGDSTLPVAPQLPHNNDASQDPHLPIPTQHLSEHSPGFSRHSSAQLLTASASSQLLHPSTPHVDLDSLDPHLHSTHNSSQPHAEGPSQFIDHMHSLIQPASNTVGSSHSSTNGSTTSVTDLQFVNGSTASGSSMPLRESSSNTAATTNSTSTGTGSGKSEHPQDGSSTSSSNRSSVHPSNGMDSISTLSEAAKLRGARDKALSSSGVPPFHLVNMAWGLARLQHNVPEAWTRAYNEALQLNWWQLRPHALSNAAWAAAVLGLSSEPAHTQAYCEACTLKMHRANAYDLSMILWSLALRSVRPCNQWMEQFLGAMLRALPTAEPRHVARVMWALAKLKWRPSPSWAARVFQQTELQAFEFDGHAFSITLWSVSSLGLKPPSEWLETMLVAAFEGGLSDYGPQELTNLLESLGRLRFAPEYAWMDLFWAVSYQKLGQFRPEELASILSAAVKVGHQPPAQWLSVYLKVVGRVMLHALSSPASTRAGAAASQHGKLAQQQAVDSGSEDGTTTLPLHGFARILAGLAALEVTPSQRWMTAFFEVTKRQLHSLRGARSSADAAAPAKQQPGTEAGLMQSSSSTTTTTTSSGTVGNADGAGISQPWSGACAPAAPNTVPPPAGFAGSGAAQSAGSPTAIGGPAQRAAGGKLGALFESLLAGLAALGVQPPEDWLGAFFDASFPHLPSMRHRNLDGLAYAVASLGLRPSQDWSQASVDAIECRLTEAQTRGEKVNRTSLGRCLLGIRYLQGPSSPVYQRWKDADWIGPALELYAYDARVPQRKMVPQSTLARGLRARRPVRRTQQGQARLAVD